MISSIVTIPSSLLQDRLIPLLDITDLVRLDTAVINHKARRLFLDQLQGARLATESIQIDNKVAQWLLNRKLKITTLNVIEEDSDLDIVKQLAASVDTIVKIENCTRTPTVVAVIHLIMACKNVKSIFLVNISKADYILDSISENCHALQAINISESWININDQLIPLMVRCKFFTDLILDECCPMNDEFAATIAVNCLQLKKLSIGNCNNCRDGTLQVLAEHCHDLRYLSFRGIRSLTEEGLRSLAAGCAELRTFLSDNHTRITSDGIIALAQGCTKLEEINIPESDEQVDLAVAALVQHCPALKTLRCWSHHLTDMSLQYLQNCQLLHTLEIKGSSLSITSLLQFLDCCVNLQCLLVTRIRHFCYDPCGFRLTRTLHALQKITLEYCSSLTDAEFIQWISQCPNLMELVLVGCCDLTDASVLAVAAYCKKLTNIYLDISPVSDQTICELVKSCPNLRDISLLEAENLTYSASAIARHCPFLRLLDVSCCSKITDAGIEEILQKCCHLRELVLFDCSELTNAVLDAVIQFGARLRKFDLRACDKVSADAVEAFNKVHPYCVLEAS